MKVSFNENDKVFFVSDTHWWHTNIIKYCNRPFDTVEEMNENLISNWNSVVNKEDTVFHLGDFAFCGVTKYKSILEQLNGNIILIKGNHDHFKCVDKFFSEIYQQVTLRIGDKIVYLNHYPFLNFPEECYQLHGHIHSIGNSSVSKNQYDVGVDNNDFIPITWKQIKEINGW